MEEMAVATINEAVYGKLLARTLPRIIKNQAENERMIAELEKLDMRDRPLTPEEEGLAELMTLLIRQFEESRYPLGHAKPVRGGSCAYGEPRSSPAGLDCCFRFQQRRFQHVTPSLFI
jgi:hypothetical protein